MSLKLCVREVFKQRICPASKVFNPCSRKFCWSRTCCNPLGDARFSNILTQAQTHWRHNSPLQSCTREQKIESSAFIDGWFLGFRRQNVSWHPSELVLSLCPSVYEKCCVPPLLRGNGDYGTIYSMLIWT